MGTTEQEQVYTVIIYDMKTVGTHVALVNAISSEAAAAKSRQGITDAFARFCASAQLANPELLIEQYTEGLFLIGSRQGDLRDMADAVVGTDHCDGDDHDTVE